MPEHRSFSKQPLRALVALLLGAPAMPAQAQSLQVAGKLGFLQEWELTATVTRDGSGAEPRFSGPLTLKHVGLCGPGGPEEKSGTITLRMDGEPPRAKATLVANGLECTYAGELSVSYTGLMTCAKQKVPVSLWLK